MSLDFRTNALQVNKVIAAGANGTSAQLLVYSIDAEGTPANQGSIDSALFDTTSIGTDIFLYVSGSAGSAGTPNTYGASVFGGDLVVSGNVIINGSFGDVQKATTTTSNDMPAVIWQCAVNADEFYSIDLTLLAKDSSSGDIGRWARNILVYDDGFGAVFAGPISATIPDYNSESTWGMNILISSNNVVVYVTGSAASSVNWLSRSTVSVI